VAGPLVVAFVNVGRADFAAMRKGCAPGLSLQFAVALPTRRDREAVVRRRPETGAAIAGPTGTQATARRPAPLLTCVRAWSTFNRTNAGPATTVSRSFQIIQSPKLNVLPSIRLDGNRNMLTIEWPKPMQKNSMIGIYVAIPLPKTLDQSIAPPMPVGTIQLHNTPRMNGVSRPAAQCAA